MSSSPTGDALTGIGHIGHTVPPLAFAASRPRGVVPTPEDEVFDPRVHLALENPAWVQTLARGQRVAFPVPVRRTEHAARAREDGFPGLAYSAPFRLLSDAGVAALRRVIAANERFATCVPSRIPKCIRGLGYRSKFVRDLNYDPHVLGHLAAMCGVPLGPHTMGSNLSQTNFGEIGRGVNVDQWHCECVVVPFPCS